MEDNPPIEEVLLVQPIEIVQPVTLEGNLPTEKPAPTARHSNKNYTKKDLYYRWVHAKDQLFGLREDVARLSKELKTVQKEVFTYDRKQASHDVALRKVQQHTQSRHQLKVEKKALPEQLKAAVNETKSVQASKEDLKVTLAGTYKLSEERLKLTH